MKIFYECYDEGIGEIRYFITKTGFVGLMEVSTNTRTGISNIIFRVGFSSRGYISEEQMPEKFKDMSIIYSNQKVITEMKSGDVCLILNMFGNLFSKLSDELAEQKIVEVVFFSDFHSVISILNTKELLTDKVKNIIKKLEKPDTKKDIKKDSKDKKDEKK